MNGAALDYSAPGLGRRILVVDDDGVQRKLVRLQLELAGFRVAEAAGATSARQTLGDGDLPEAIVSDVVMDDVDGFTFCHALRRDARFDATPIVLISSAFDEAEDIELARSVGASALVRRTESQQPCVEALVRALAEGARREERSASEMPPLFGSRVVHQLARLNEQKAAVEARFGVLYENAIDAISVMTADGIVLDVNRRWEEITGIPREELRGRPIELFSAFGDEESNRARYDEVIGQGGGRSGPVAIRSASSGTIYMEFSASTTEIDGRPTVLAVGRDVTALVEARRKLEASERHYRSLVESVPDVLWNATPDWTYTYFSPNIEKLCGFTAEDIFSGAHGATLGRVHPDDIERVRAARVALTTTVGATMDVECRWRHRDGRWLWLHVRGVRTETSIDGMFLDITARKQLEEQLCQAQKLEAVGQLTAGVAHDFNNILAVMSMNTTYLLELLDRESESWAAANDIAEAAARGTEVTKQLLAFSRRSASAPKKLDVNELLSGLTRMIAQTVGKEIRLAIDREPLLGLVHADPGQLEQVVMNLVVNARDAMRGRGALRLTTASIHRDGNEKAKWGPTRAGEYVRISVTDDGCGMDTATVERIFEPFFTTKPEGSGTGLGLSTCYGIVRHAGGTIEVETAPGRGATFHVYLPRTDAVG